MVRLRKKNGATEAVDNLEAIEIVDADGLLGMVVFTGQGDLVRAMIPGDPLFTAYCRAHGLWEARVKVHPPYPIKSGL